MVTKDKDNVGKKRILLVEDDKFIVRAYLDGFERNGLMVEHAGNGVDALNSIKKSSPDLVLLDIVMPGQNGFEVLKSIKSDPKMKNVPVVILSNLGQESDVKKGLELGAHDYLLKVELSMAEIVEKVRGYLS